MPFFIDNIIHFDINKKEEIIKNVFLRIATKEEQSIIKRLLVKFGRPQDIFDFDYHEYKSKNPNNFQGSLKKRNEDDFRYFVLEELNSEKYNLILPKAFFLTEKEFFSPFGFFKTKKGGLSIKYSFEELSVFSYYNDINMTFGDRPKNLTKSFDKTDKEQVEKNISLLNNFETIKDDFPIIDKALTDFFKISEISNNSVFKVVSYFACLELLLVNSNMENLKPIKFQLETKLNLLNNRFEKPINILNYIKGPDTLTLGNVMKIIYAYRSSIAHGDFIDFTKKLHLLEKASMSDILIFLRIVLKNTILFSLKEPELVRDLKKC
jgi:hypothetical protein